ncbi:MAG: sugar phosphate isomerase/epimerase family protein [Nitrososphaerales archaeon]
MVSVGISSQFLFQEGKGVHDLAEYIESDPFRKPQPAIWQVLDEGPQQLVGSNLKEVKELVSKGFRISVHAPNEKQFNIAHHDPRTRNDAIHRMKNSLEAAASCEAVWWILHAGYDTQGGRMLDDVKENNNDSIQKLWDLAHSLGIPLLVENAPPLQGYDLVSPERFIDLISGAGIKLKVAFDIGHSKMSKNIPDFVDRVSSAFMTVECSDNDGEQDLHLPLEEDNPEWKGTIDRLCDTGYAKAFVVETNEDPLPSFSALSKYVSQRFLLF